jgi:hypothetical protein
LTKYFVLNIIIFSSLPFGAFYCDQPSGEEESMNVGISHGIIQK